MPGGTRKIEETHFETESNDILVYFGVLLAGMGIALFFMIRSIFFCAAPEDQLKARKKLE